jgi:hypothetical protein
MRNYSNPEFGKPIDEEQKTAATNLRRFITPSREDSHGACAVRDMLQSGAALSSRKVDNL